MENDYWGKNTLEFLTFHLGNATQIVRIATGFFTVEGYNLLREVLKGKQVRLMVGYDEQSRDRLREKLIEDVMRHLNVWSGINRREAVVALVEALQKNGWSSMSNLIPTLWMHAYVQATMQKCISLTKNGQRRDRAI